MYLLWLKCPMALFYHHVSHEAMSVASGNKWCTRLTQYNSENDIFSIVTVVVAHQTIRNVLLEEGSESRTQDTLLF